MATGFQAIGGGISASDAKQPHGRRRRLIVHIGQLHDTERCAQCAGFIRRQRRELDLLAAGCNKRGGGLRRRLYLSCRLHLS